MVYSCINYMHISALAKSATAPLLKHLGIGQNLKKGLLITMIHLLDPTQMTASLFLKCRLYSRDERSAADDSLVKPDLPILLLLTKE